MTCKKYIDKLSLYVNNELTEIEAYKISQHIKECEDCSTKTAELNALLYEMSLFEDIEPPADFLEKLTNRAENELWNDKAKANYKMYLKYSSVAALFIIGIFSVVYLNFFNGYKSKVNSVASAPSAASSDSFNSGNKGKLNSNFAYEVENSNKIMQDVDQSSEKDVNKSVNSDVANAPVTNNNIAGNVSVDKSKKENILLDNSTDIIAEKTIIPDITTVITPTPNNNNKSDSDKVTIFTLQDKTAADMTSTPVPEVVDNYVFNQVQVKVKNIDTALNFIREETKKVNGTEIPMVKAAMLTIQGTSHVEEKSAKAIVETQNGQIIIEVKKENAESFIKSIKEYFGEANVKITTDEKSPVGIIRYEINVFIKN